MHFAQCMVHCINHEYDAAYEVVKAVPHFGKATPDWRRLTTLVYLRRFPSDGYGQALDECNDVIAWTKQDAKGQDSHELLANLYGRKAFYHLNLNQYYDAEASCKIALDLYRGYLAPYRLMASISLRRGQPERVIEYLSESIARRSDGPHFWDYANRGKAFLDINDIRSAIADLNTAHQLNPQEPTVISNLGIAEDMQGNETGAWRLYGLALQLNYNWAPAHHNRGVMFFRLKQHTDAENCFTRAIRSEPTMGCSGFIVECAGLNVICTANALAI